ncbi:MAG: hypothetical protein HC896_02390 [Bacteroidales bacterium]|nr:hypothetical protein [Bacteroidales bacterium]
MIFIFPGVMCLVLFPGLESSDQAYLTMITGLLPTGLIGLIVAALLAALINTIAAGLNSFSTVFTLDIYAKRIKPDATQKQQRAMGQLVTIAVAMLAMLLAMLFSNAGKDLFNITQGVAQFLAPPLTVVFLAGVLSKRVTKKAAEWTLYGGGALCVLVGIMYFVKFPSEAFWPHFYVAVFFICLPC